LRRVRSLHLLSCTHSMQTAELRICDPSAWIHARLPAAAAMPHASRVGARHRSSKLAQLSCFSESSHSPGPWYAMRGCRGSRSALRGTAPPRDCAQGWLEEQSNDPRGTCEGLPVRGFCWQLASSGSISLHRTDPTRSAAGVPPPPLTSATINGPRVPSRAHTQVQDEAGGEEGEGLREILT